MQCKLVALGDGSLQCCALKNPKFTAITGSLALWKRNERENMHYGDFGNLCNPLKTFARVNNNIRSFSKRSLWLNTVEQM